MSGYRRLALALWLPLFGLFGPHPDVAAQPRGRTPAVEGEAPAPSGSRGENFSSKPAPALFNSDCTGGGCHKGPQGLGKEMSQGSLVEFLREHYTNSRQSAAALAAYLRSAPAGRPQMTPEKPERSERPSPRSRAAARSEEGAKPEEATPSARPPRRPPAEIMREEGAHEGNAKPEPRKPLPKPAPRSRQVTVAPPPPPPPAAAPEPAAPPPAPPPAPPAPKGYDIFD